MENGEVCSAGDLGKSENCPRPQVLYCLWGVRTLVPHGQRILPRDMGRRYTPPGKGVEITFPAGESVQFTKGGGGQSPGRQGPHVVHGRGGQEELTSPARALTPPFSTFATFSHSQHFSAKQETSVFRGLHFFACALTRAATSASSRTHFESNLCLPCASRSPPPLFTTHLQNFTLTHFLSAFNFSHFFAARALETVETSTGLEGSLVLFSCRSGSCRNVVRIGRAMLWEQGTRSNQLFQLVGNLPYEHLPYASPPYEGRCSNELEELNSSNSVEHLRCT